MLPWTVSCKSVLRAHISNFERKLRYSRRYVSCICIARKSRNGTVIAETDFWRVLRVFHVSFEVDIWCIFIVSAASMTGDWWQETLPVREINAVELLAGDSQTDGRQ